MPQMRIKERLILAALLAAFALLFACGDANEQAVFNSDTNSHPEGWADPLSIGHDNYHATLMKEVSSSSRGRTLFARRCALCHGKDANGKIGPRIFNISASSIAGVIGVVPLMKGQSDLSSSDIQAIADYIAELRDGATPVTTTLNTELCVNCHGSDLDGGISGISCFSCHNGPDGSIGHPGLATHVWHEAKDDPLHYHGTYGRRFSAACTNCHGYNLQGHAGPACDSCHDGVTAAVLDFVPPPIVPNPTGQSITLTISLTGSSEVPPVVTTGSGTATLIVDLDTREISGTLAFSGLSSAATAAHIHQAAAGANGPIAVALTGGAGGTSGVGTVPATILTEEQFNVLKADGLYINVHTSNNPAGEIRGQIIFTGVTLSATLSGAQMVPPVVTTGSGSATLTANTSTRGISGTVTFSGLTGNATAAHIHQAPAGSNGGVIAALTGGAGGTSGTWTIPSGTILTVEQFNAFMANGLYFNIHTTTNLDGEIRGQIVFAELSGAQEVPAVTTSGSGTYDITVNTGTGEISGTVTFSGLSSNASVAHIHQAAAGAVGPVIVSLEGGAGATSGVWTIPTGTILTAEQITAYQANGLYFNVHSTINPSGEIRGQIIAQ
ncbi:MAG: CHRD domain-containing protein [Nitrospirae bacterium]|nr:CHRD domain-containing protein [Nitrospirota bacterium]